MRWQPDRHSKGTHTLFGIAAVAMGVILGVFIVFLNSATDSQWGVPQAQAGNEECTGGEEQYTCPYPQKKKKPDGTTIECMFDKKCTNVTNDHVTEGGCQAPGKCFGKTGDGKPLEGKPMMMPMMMGGMPPMLPMLPMMMPKMSMPPDPCGPTNALGTSSAGCAGRDASSSVGGVSGFLTSLFGNNSSSPSSGIGSTIQSVGDKLWSFITGDTESMAVVNTNANTNANASGVINNPTEATVFPVTASGSNAGQVSSQSGDTSGDTNSTQGNVNAQTVTGFGGGASSDVDTSTGPILSAIDWVIRQIQNILPRIF